MRNHSPTSFVSFFSESSMHFIFNPHSTKMFIKHITCISSPTLKLTTHYSIYQVIMLQPIISSIINKSSLSTPGQLLFSISLSTTFAKIPSSTRNNTYKTTFLYTKRFFFFPSLGLVWLMEPLIIFIWDLEIINTIQLLLWRSLGGLATLERDDLKVINWWVLILRSMCYSSYI